MKEGGFMTNPREVFSDCVKIGAANSPQEFRLSVTLTVRDVEHLWRMAAARALELTGLAQSEVEDVIGPCEDPQIADCLGMLLAPRPVAGCVFKTISIEKIERTSRKNDKPRMHLLSQSDWDALLPRQPRN
jgi:hypothetical protein